MRGMMWSAVLLTSLWTGAVRAMTPDEFVEKARQAYAKDGKSLTNTNDMKGAAFHDRHSGMICWVSAPEARNIRDIGGWTGLRTGRAYRGTQICATPGRPLGLTERGLCVLRDELGIRTDLDLRRKDELYGIVASPLGTKVRFVHAPIEPYADMLKTPEAYATALRVFADEKNYPVYFHCWGGADRTGLIAMFLEALCGVNVVDVQIDYELTTFAGSLRSREAPYYRIVFNWLMDEPGRSLAEKAKSFVCRNFGLTEDEVRAIRRNLMVQTSARLTESAKPGEGRGEGKKGR